MTKYNPHHRRSVRKPGYDYTSNGAYYVTIRVQHKTTVLSMVVENRVELTEYGRIIKQEWDNTAIRRPYVKLDAFIIMPDHIHGVLWITKPVGARRAVPLHVPPPREFGKPISGSLPTIIGAFKSAITRRVNEHRNTPGMAFWQRNYHNQIIGDIDELRAIREYIWQNPRNWREGKPEHVIWK